MDATWWAFGRRPDSSLSGPLGYCRAVAAKASLKQAKARDKDARAKQRRRAEMRAGLKRRAARLFERVR